MHFKLVMWPAALLLCLQLCSSWLPNLSWFMPQALASVLPEHYPPQIDGRQGPQVDQDLKIWFAEHVDQLAVVLLNETDYQALLKKSDRFTQLYIASQRGQSILRGTQLKELRDALDQELALAKKESRAAHPLAPYVMQSILVRGAIPESDGARLEAFLLEVAPRSCPARKAFMRSISKDHLDALADEALIQAFGKIRDYRSQAFRRQAYDVFFSNISGMKRPLLKSALPNIMPDIEGSVGRHVWLSDLLDNVAGGKSLKPLAKSREESKAGRCKEAEKFLVDALDAENSIFGSKKPPDLLEDMIQTGHAITRCTKRRGVAPGLAFWTGLMPKFEKIFEFPGKAAVLQRMASLLWNADQMDGAKVYARQLLAEAKASKSVGADAIVLKAEFLLARILDDNMERSEAKELFADFVARNSGDADFEVALSALVLSRFESGEFAAALEPLALSIARQDKLPPEKRSTSIIVFALFWQGRIYAATGKQDFAIAAWRRLATEYYSTYYGVLGHVLYERATGKKIVLEPSRVPRFPADFLTAPYAGEDRVTMARVGALYRLGQASDAICELREVRQNPSDMEQTAARALALYAGKEWLDAIKVMDALPRAYRNSLPLGFERMFFPREHDNLVFDYAKRLKMDPDFIFALIRQESVFNPKAQSPVGASGLMQLMPATAKYELGQLSKGYISTEKRAKFGRAILNKSNLGDPELNVALGVHHVFRLFTTFKNPILMLSAYNASPTAAEKWSREISFADPLIALERIPYQETRTYVKLIMRNYFYYKRWYVGAHPQMPYIEYLLTKTVKK